MVLARPIAILLLAITLGEALEPLVSRLQRKMSRALAIAVVYAALAALTAAVVWLVAPDLSAQFNDIRGRVPQLVEQLQQRVTQWNAAIGGAATRFLSGGASEVAKLAVGLPLKVAAGLIELLLVVFVMSRETQSSQALVIFALLAGAAVAGCWGDRRHPSRRGPPVVVIPVIAPAVRRRTGAEAPSEKL